jgi:ABC-type polysaccharide/polyol phosphate export permease
MNLSCQREIPVNPLAILVETFKWGLFGVGDFYGAAFATTALMVICFVMGGLVYFARTEARTIAVR